MNDISTNELKKFLKNIEFGRLLEFTDKTGNVIKTIKLEVEEIIESDDFTTKILSTPISTITKVYEKDKYNKLVYYQKMNNSEVEVTEEYIELFHNHKKDFIKSGSRTPKSAIVIDLILYKKIFPYIIEDILYYIEEDDIIDIYNKQEKIIASFRLSKYTRKVSLDLIYIYSDESYEIIQYNDFGETIIKNTYNYNDQIIGSKIFKVKVSKSESFIKCCSDNNKLKLIENIKYTYDGNKVIEHRLHEIFDSKIEKEFDSKERLIYYKDHKIEWRSTYIDNKEYRIYEKGIGDNHRRTEWYREFDNKKRIIHFEDKIDHITNDYKYHENGKCEPIYQKHVENEFSFEKICEYHDGLKNMKCSMTSYMDSKGNKEIIKYYIDDKGIQRILSESKEIVDAAIYYKYNNYKNDDTKNIINESFLRL